MSLLGIRIAISPTASSSPSKPSRSISARVHASGCLQPDASDRGLQAPEHSLDLGAITKFSPPPRSLDDKLPTLGNVCAHPCATILAVPTDSYVALENVQWSFGTALPEMSGPSDARQDELLQLGIRYRLMQNLGSIVEPFTVQTDEGNAAFPIEIIRREMRDALVIRDKRGAIATSFPVPGRPPRQQSPKSWEPMANRRRASPERRSPPFGIGSKSIWCPVTSGSSSGTLETANTRSIARKVRLRKFPGGGSFVRIRLG